MELSKLRLQINELKDAMDTAIIDQDFILAQTLKMELNRVTAEQVDLHEEIQRQKAITVEVCPQALPYFLAD